LSCPVLEINLSLLRQNATVILDLCRKNGIRPTAVVKGFSAIREVVEMLADVGYTSFGSSRLPHLQAVRRMNPSLETVALRIPMMSEAESVVRCADVSLNSQLETVRLLDRAAEGAGKTHAVILMVDLGDLREGLMDEAQILETARGIETGCRNIRLCGVGTNLGCYGSVVPTGENLSRLASIACEIEERIGRELEVVSGGASTSLALLVEGGMPSKINNLRVGSAIITRAEVPEIPDEALPGLSDETFILRAEIIEIGEKPTHPIGLLGRDCFGNIRKYEDRGVRKRTLLALGAFDVGHCEKLIPLDTEAKILGCSSDHMIVDIHESRENYRLGGEMAFKMLYPAILFAASSPLVKKKMVEKKIKR
jgi:predicted amino acid racemase